MPKYVNTVYGFPREDVDPKEKQTNSYGYAYGKAIYSAYTNNRTSISISEKQQFTVNRMYGRGSQPIEKYMTAFYGKDWQSIVAQRKALLNINWEIMSVMPKYKDVLLGMFTDIEYNATCSAIDELSGAEKQTKKLNALIEMMLKPYIDKLVQETGIPVEQTKKEEIPTDIEELQIYEQIGKFKTNDEASMEKYVQVSFETPRFKEVKREIINELIDCSKAICREVMNKETGTIDLEYIDIQNAIYKYDRSRGSNDLRYAGHIERVPISYIRGRTSLCEDELYQLASTNFGLYGNPTRELNTSYRNRGNNESYLYDDIVVPIFNFSFKTVDESYTTNIKNNYGGAKVVHGDFGKVVNNDKKKTKVSNIYNVYSGKWIIGKDTEDGIFEYGLLEYIPRKNPKEVSLDYHLFVLETTPITQRCIPMLDQMHMAWLRVQNDLAMSAPKGEAIDVSAISNVNIGGTTFSTLDILEMRRKVGTLLYKGTSTRGMPNAPASARPIQELTGGIGKGLDENLMLIDKNNQLIQEISGITAIAAASQVNSEQGLGVSQLALASTNNALKPIYTEYVKTKEFIAECICSRGKYLAKYEPVLFKKIVGSVIGTASAEIMEISSDVTLREFGIRMTVKPTDQMIQALRQTAMQALSVGKNGTPLLTYDQYIFIERALSSNMNLKDIEMYLSYRLKKAEEDQQKVALENQKANQQMQLQMEQVKQQAEMEKQKIELLKIDKKGEWEVKVEYAKSLFGLALKEGLEGGTDEQMKQKLIEMGITLPTMPTAQGMGINQQQQQQQQMAEQPQQQEVPQEEVPQEEVSQEQIPQ